MPDLLAWQHFNQLTPGEAERLGILTEECGEVSQAVGKILRHGYLSKWPPENGSPTNREKLEEELGDILAMIGLMIAAGDINPGKLHERLLYKLRERLPKYVHHQSAALLTRARLTAEDAYADEATEVTPEALIPYLIHECASQGSASAAAHEIVSRFEVYQR